MVNSWTWRFMFRRNLLPCARGSLNVEYPTVINGFFRGITSKYNEVGFGITHNMTITFARCPTGRLDGGPYTYVVLELK
jgi:hypothetical protein